jgi:hypothetical protein
MTRPIGNYKENPDQHHNTCISARVLRFESVCRCLRVDRGD